MACLAVEDWLNRLVEVKRGDGAATPTTQRVYAYDESDNRTFLDDHVNNLSLHYTYDAADQILEIRQGTLASRDTVNDFQTVVESFTHNDDGMMTSRTVDPNGTPVTTDYTWDEFDNLVEIDGPLGSVSNSYDTGGIRKQKTGSDGIKTEFHYSGLPVLSEERDPDGAAVPTSFVHGHAVLGFENGSGFFYFLPDGFSSVRVLVEADGDEAAHYIHGEFGQRAEVVEGTGSSSQTWIGGLGVRDEFTAAGLYYMRQRWFEPTLGRFLSRDPIGYAGGLNLFAYAYNNPVTLNDATGLDPMMRRTPVPDAYKKDISRAIQIISSLGYKREAMELSRQLQSGELKLQRSRFNVGFTDPLTSNISVDESYCEQGPTQDDYFVRLASLLFHESTHAVTQYKTELAAYGWEAYIMGNKSSETALELDVYTNQLGFLKTWLRHERRSSVQAALQTEITGVSQTVRALLQYY